MNLYKKCFKIISFGFINLSFLITLAAPAHGKTKQLAQSKASKRYQFIHNLVAPVTGSKIPVEFNLSSQSRNCYVPLTDTVYLSCYTAHMIDEIIQQKSHVTVKLLSYNSIIVKIPLLCARAYFSALLFHELGHFVHKHPAVNNRYIRIEHEKMADAFAAQSLESIMGGTLMFLLEDAVLKVYGRTRGYKVVDTHKLYNDIAPYSYHPSHYERLTFFKNALKKHLQLYPQDRTHYLSFKAAVEKIQFKAYGHLCKLSLDI